MPKLVLCTQASHADIKPSLLPIYNHYSATNMRQPPSFSMTLGVAHVVTKLGYLSTKVTFCHNLS